MQKEHAFRRGAHVREKTTGVFGIVLDCRWLVDMKTTAPAEPAYMVHFDDGRVIRRVESDLRDAYA